MRHPRHRIEAPRPTLANHPALSVLLSRGRVGEGSQVAEDRLLGVVRYGEDVERAAAAPAPAAQVPLRGLEPGVATLLWLGQTATTAASGSEHLACRCDGTTLFGAYRQQAGGPETTEDTVYTAYRTMLEAAFSAGYPHVYRIWNYVPEINREVAGLEVYKAFCIGRQRAFDDDPLPMDAAVPAATAIGTRSPGFSLYFLAGKQAATPLSNPRQVEAYRYPPQYGPRSPLFSRAVVVPHGPTVMLHLSGTASIVGHATRHSDQIGAQLAETVTNVAAVLQQVGIELADLGANALFTVYLRREGDFALVRRGLEDVLPPAVGRIFCAGDICRNSLLLEIEGIMVTPAR